jgi:gliding motility-associated-like protein
MYTRLLVLFVILFQINVHSQLLCDESVEFCTSTGLVYPASTGSTAPAGLDYGCLLTQPNPTWFFLNIDVGGDIEITIDNSAGVDLDFAVWGPFTTYLDMETSVCGGTGGAPVSCSYSAGALEIVQLTNSQPGEFYMLLITNFSGLATNITADQTGGSGSTNCGNTSCFISNFSANIGACQPNNSYNVTGTIDFSTNISTDSLLVIVDDGIASYDTVLYPPFVSPANWSISGLPANGNPLNVTAFFAADPVCDIALNANAPADCSCMAQIGNFELTINGSPAANNRLCFGDYFEITSTTGFVPPSEANNPPGPDYNPGIAYLIYSCTPTIGVVPSNVPPNDNFTNDPCFVGLLGYGTSFVDTNLLGGPNVTGTWTDNTIYIVPLTMYDTVGGNYSYVNTSLLCYEMGEPIAIQYLPKIDTANASVNCIENEFLINVSGGLPAINGSDFNMINLLPSYASFENSTLSSGEDVIITGLIYGDNYSFDVTDNNGCLLTVSGGPFSCETIDENTEFHIYSGITPNNDGNNDAWIIDGLPMGSHPATIFNRWGDVIWQTDNYDNVNSVWQGLNQEGLEVPEGVYFYAITIEGINYKGFIELTR